MKREDPDSFSDFLKKCLEEDPDFGKVANDKPHKEFAFEISGSHSVSSVALLDLESASAQLQGVNDYGHAVTNIPVGVTSVQVHFPFSPFVLRLPIESGLVTVGTFIWHIARQIACMVEAPGDFEIAADDSDGLLRLEFYRCYYSDDEENWLITFDDSES